MLPPGRHSMMLSAVDLAALLAVPGVQVTVQITVPPAAAVDPHGWRASARAIAAELRSQQPGVVLHVEALARAVRREMATRQHEPGMTGRGGRVPSVGSISRHVLRRGHSFA
jgi:hypothetical protein